MTFTLTQEQYEALVALARAGAPDPNTRRNLDAYLLTIEKANNITRHSVWVQWQEQDAPLPPSTSFPESWPPMQRAYIEYLGRPVAKSDVLKVVNEHARRPVTILVTKDPGATLGWTPIDQFFIR